MKTMRNTITTIALCLCALLSCASLHAADASQDDEKITVPRTPSAPSVPGGISPPAGTRRSADPSAPTHVAPSKSGTVILVPPSPVTGGTAVPAPTPGPSQERTVIVPHPPGTSPADPADPAQPVVIPTIPATPVVPVLPGKTSPAEVPAIPVLPGKTAPVEIPALPVQPQTSDRILIQTPTPQVETAPQKETLAPQPASPPIVSEPGRQASPMDFLPMPTPLAPDKAQFEPESEEPTQAPLKTEQQAKPKSGDPLRIPSDAARTDDLSFLEGCWRTPSTPSRGRLPDIDWRFCFDKDGIGKRTTQLPKEGTCTGAAKGHFDTYGRLIFTSEAAYCTGSRLSISTPVVVCEKKNGTTLCNFGDPRSGSANPQTFPLIRE